MLFSELIKVLKKGDSDLQSFSLFENPEIISAASLEKANSNQISFLEKGSYLLKELHNSNASALILPNQESFINKAKDKKIKL